MSGPDGSIIKQIKASDLRKLWWSKIYDGSARWVDKSIVQHGESRFFIFI